jgi:hypothetical protein
MRLWNSCGKNGLCLAGLPLKNVVFQGVLRALKNERLEVGLDCEDELFNVEFILVKGMLNSVQIQADSCKTFLGLISHTC